MTSFSRQFFGGIFLILIFGVFSLLVSNHQFGGYDLSPIVDLHWRFTQGQIPGVDFVNTMPLILLFFVKLVSFGVLHWSDLIFSNILVTFFVFLFLIFTPSKNKQDLSFIFAFTAIICLPLIYSNHVWHSSISQLTAICFFYSSFIFIESSKPGVKSQIFLGIGSGFLFISKQNIAPLVILIIMMVASLNFNNKWTYVRSSVLGILFVLICSLFFLHMPFEEFIHSQAAILGRAKPDISMFIAFAFVKSHYPLILLTLVMIFLVMRPLKNIFAVRRDIFLLIVISSVSSMIPILTDWDVKLNDLPLPLFIFSLTIARFGSVRNRAGMFISLFLIVLIALVGGYTRERMFHVGDFYEKENTNKISNGYFSDLHVGERLYKVIAEIENVKKIQPNAIIFFGPRIEFGYTLTNTSSPTGLPLWWHPGTSYSLKDEGNVINEFKNKNFDIIVFLKDDRTRLPQVILTYIDSSYRKSEKYDSLDLYMKIK